MQYVSIKIENFKGIKNSHYDFGKRTTILGRNGAGKTTILDAITWCLHGKNLVDRKLFSIMPLNSDGTESNEKVTVILTMKLDGEDRMTTLERTLSGSVTSLLINEAPVKHKEYERWVEDNISTMDRFKIFSDPLYFANMNWKDQRDTFMDFFQEPDVDDIIATMKSGVSTDLAEKLHKMPAEKIIELAHTKTTEYQEKQNSIQSKIDLLNDQIARCSANTVDKDLIARREELKEILDNSSAILQKYTSYQKDLSEAERNVVRTESMLQERMRKISSSFSRVKEELKYNLERSEDKAKRAYQNLRDANTDTVDTICPMCGQDLPESDVNSLREKASGIIAEKENEYAEAKRRYTEAKQALDNSGDAPDFNSDDECISLKRSLTDYKKTYNDLKATTPEKPGDLSVLRNEYDGIVRELASVDRIDEHKSDLKKYKDELKKNAILLEASERIEKDAGQYIVARAKYLLELVDSQFRTISVKLFIEQKNGKTKDCFEITKDGVPYADLNKTGKLSAGLEFLKYFKDQNNLNIPVIIDDFESYRSIDLGLLSDVQVIVTKVDENYKELTCRVN